jgi:Tfp pilus assembly protein PilX
MLHRSCLITNTHGTVLVASLMFVMLLGALGVTTVMMTTQYTTIAGNHKATVQALHVAEAGAEEARNRLRDGAVSVIHDTAPTSTQWHVYIGTDPNARREGYTAGPDQSRVESVQTLLNYTVKVRHALNGAGAIRKTPSGATMYEVTSVGSLAGARSIVQTYIASAASLSLPGTVYVEAPTSINGTSTHIIGADQCGTDDKPGIATPLDATTSGQLTIKVNGGPEISGTPSSNPNYPNDSYSIVTNTTNIDVKALVKTYTASADIVPTDASPKNVSWGSPDLTATPPTCSEMHIVAFQSNVRLDGGITGCGVLVVDGSLDIHGGLQWYGPILVSGAITFTGGGSDAVNIAGALLSGDTTVAQVPDKIGGTVTIKNCSTAIKGASKKMPWTTLSWGTL